MKMKMLLVVAAVLCFGAFAAPESAQAASLHVSIGDRPYYHGQHYYRGGLRHVWVPGHWEYRRYGRVWVRGHYVRVFGRNHHYVRRGSGHYRPRSGGIRW